MITVEIFDVMIPIRKKKLVKKDTFTIFLKEVYSNWTRDWVDIGKAKSLAHASLSCGFFKSNKFKIKFSRPNFLSRDENINNERSDNEQFETPGWEKNEITKVIKGLGFLVTLSTTLHRKFANSSIDFSLRIPKCVGGDEAGVWVGVGIGEESISMALSKIGKDNDEGFSCWNEFVVVNKRYSITKLDKQCASNCVLIFPM